MLFLVLLLVLVAFGLLIASLATSVMAFSWASAVISVLAALVLIVDALRRRTRRRGTAASAAVAPARVKRETSDAEPAAAAGAPDAPDTRDTTDAVGTKAADGWRVRQEAPMLSGEVPAEALAVPDAAETPADVGPVADDEPAIQRSSRQNTELVATLDDEVVVVDERPRYHMRTCRWLGQQRTLPLPVGEAVELGFTPCAICRPDTELTRRHGDRPAARG